MVGRCRMRRPVARKRLVPTRPALLRRLGHLICRVVFRDGPRPDSSSSRLHHDACPFVILIGHLRHHEVHRSREVQISNDNPSLAAPGLAGMYQQYVTAVQARSVSAAITLN
jgi:hypothetical protein